MFLKISYLVIIALFLVAFCINFGISLSRDLKAKKALKKNPIYQKGIVRDIQTVKGKVFLTVEFTSSHNRLLLSETFELFESDLKGKTYSIGEEVDMIYNDVKDQKRVRNFPLILADKKIKLEKGVLFLNSALIFMAGFILVNTIYMYIDANALKTDIPLVGENGLYSNYFYILLMFVIYFILCNYMVSSIFDAPRKDVQNYLKFYGNVTKARVITFKFGKSKNSRGLKESIIDLEFSTNSGEQVKTKLTSFMYSETQEEYIDILYDPKNPKQVVYLRQ
ncbi:MAG: hypothetical protein IKC22_03185 [Bacilli bacterium]|nr:hypothetical protein [Bacilli bacterium]